MTTLLSDLYALDPVEFERLVGMVFSTLGYDVEVTKRSGDEGIDLELHRGDERSLAQCKRYRGTVGQPEIRDFYGVLIHENAVRGYFVTTGQFSLAASTWAQGKQIALTDGVDLLSALENSGLVPAPRAKAQADAGAIRPRLEDVVKAALEDTATNGRILIDGAPPDGHNYSELADHLEHYFPQQTDTSASSKLKGGSRLEEWSRSSARVRVIDEFDDFARSAMESILEWQQHGFVLVATAWEKRLPKSVLARFGRIIRVRELDWSIFDKRAKPSPDGRARADAERAMRTQLRNQQMLKELEQRRQSADQVRAGQAALKAAQDATRERINEAHWKLRAGNHPMPQDGDALDVKFIQRFKPAFVLDVHCRSGRIARELARRGVEVVGVDVEQEIATFNATRRRKRQDWRFAAIGTVDLESAFDVIVMADDAILHVALGGERWAITNMARLLRPGGVLIAGFQLIPDLLTVDAYDDVAAQAGLVILERWSAWDSALWSVESDYAVSVHRKPIDSSV